MLDNSTILVIAATVSATATGIQLLVALRYRCQALKWWSASNALLAVGCGLPLMTDFLSIAAFAMLTSFVVIMAPALILAGFHVMAGERLSALEMVVGPAILLGLVGVSLAAEDNYAQRVLVVAFGFAYYLLRSAYRLVRDDQHQLGGLRIVCAAGAVVVAIAYGLRSFDLALNGTRVLDLQADHSGALARAIGIVALSIWNAISLLLPADRLVAVDELTGLLNRRAFFSRSDDALRVANGQRRPVSLLMIDIDHFKLVNDRFGHRMGDVVLGAFARIVDTLVEDGLVARLGGEEFCVLLPESDDSEALSVAERLRNACERQLRLNLDDGSCVTVSIGLATASGGNAVLSRLMTVADEALYEAKTLGRNRVAGPRLAA